MEDSLKIRIKYHGQEVDDGTMPLDDVVTALQGFAGAYGKAANELLPSSTHELRISAIDEGSFELVVLAWVSVSQMRPALDTLRNLAEGAKYVFRIVKNVIDAKKHVKSKAFEIVQKGDNNTLVIINADGASLQIPPEALKLLQQKVLDGDLNKLTSPLSEGLIDRAQITASDDSEALETDISVNEKGFFGAEHLETSKEAEITGTLVSLNKESLRGTFRRTDGRKIPYRFTGPNATSFYAGFSFRGMVRVSGVAYFDENLNLTRLEIVKIVQMQHELPFDTEPPILP